MFCFAHLSDFYQILCQYCEMSIFISISGFVLVLKIEMVQHLNVDSQMTMIYHS